MRDLNDPAEYEHPDAGRADYLRDQEKDRRIQEDYERGKRSDHSAHLQSGLDEIERRTDIGGDCTTDAARIVQQIGNLTLAVCVLARAILSQAAGQGDPHICGHGHIVTTCGLCMRDRGR